jgi:uncharacterized membrane protein
MPRRSVAQALIWFTLMLPLFVSMAGLAIDGGVLLASRRQLQSVADGAARAGATRLDQPPRTPHAGIWTNSWRTTWCGSLRRTHR